MICSSCKKEIDNDSIFCKYCGKHLINEEDEVINIKIVDMRKMSLKLLKINKNATYKNLFDLMLQNDILPSSIIATETVEIFDSSCKKKIRSNQIEDLKFDDTILSNYFVDGCNIFLHYEGYNQSFSRIDIRDCLYGCPTSKNCKINLNIKEGGLL